MLRITDVDGNVVYAELTTDASADEMRASNERLADLGAEYETVHVYERVRLSGTDYLSMHAKATGDLEYGDSGDLGRVAAVGGGRLMGLFMTLWRLPVWPLSPDSVRHLPPERAEEARAWVAAGSTEGARHEQ